MTSCSTNQIKYKNIQKKKKQIINLNSTLIKYIYACIYIKYIYGVYFIIILSCDIFCVDFGVKYSGAHKVFKVLSRFSLKDV